MAASNSSIELVEQFRRDGYVAFPGFCSPQELQELLSNCRRFIRDIVPRMPRELVFYEDKADLSSLKQIQVLFEYDSWFRSIMFGSRFEQLAAELLQDEVTGVNLQYFNKPPASGRPTPAHQDGSYFMLEPNEAVTMWLALEDVDQENGCLRYLPGSQRTGLRPHGRTNMLGFSQGILGYSSDDENREVAISARAGDLLAHHALTVHRADGNTSQNRSRQALGFVYYSTSAEENPNRINRQQALMRELKQQDRV